MTAEAFEVAAPDGHRFGAQLFRARDASAPLLVFMPAMGTRARYYAGFGAAMAAAGVSFACFDWRGIETSSLRASRAVNFGYRHLLEEDLPAALRALHERLPGAATWIGGHSLGGQLAACHGASHADEVAGIVLIAAGTVDFRAWPGMLKFGILAFSQATLLIGAAVGHYPGRRIGFGGQEARGVMGDWAGVARSGRYRVKGSRIDYEAAMKAFDKPVLALGFEADRFAPAAAAEHLVRKLAHAGRTTWRWSAADTGGAALDHFSWAKRPERVAPRVAAWILQPRARATA